MLLGYPSAGHVSTYYPSSASITNDEIDAVSKFMAAKGLLPENTRLRKTSDGDFELLIASGIASPPPREIDTIDQQTKYAALPELGGKTLTLVYGDHREEMAKIALHIKKAGNSADNATQEEMMDWYAKSFGSGSLKAIKESQKLWVKDLGPAVECNIGFVETMRDPAGTRAEWEGFVAVVNKERTKAFEKLVRDAPSNIPKLPWGSEFEKDTFVPPDFTSLDVLSFATSG
jgi:dipeptidyl-peptidase-3